MTERYGKKKRKRDDDIFDVTVSEVIDKNMEAELMYHIQTNRCPYNKLECAPENCIYGRDGINKCPIHYGG